MHAGIWLGVAAFILYGLGWAQLVRFNWRLDDTVLIRDVLMFAPVVVPLVASWAAFYEVDRSLYLTGSSDGAGAAAAIVTRPQYLLLHARHYLGLLLLPVLLVLVVQDLARMLAPALGAEESAGWLMALTAGMLLVGLPPVLRWLWHTEPLAAGPLRAKLIEVGRLRGLQCREILVWHTGRLVVNAAVAGFLPRLRYVLLTDALLTRFGDEEIALIFAHEVGHVRRRHLLWRLLVLALPLVVWMLWREVWPGPLAAGESWLRGHGVPRAANDGVPARGRGGLHGARVFPILAAARPGCRLVCLPVARRSLMSGRRRTLLRTSRKTRGGHRSTKDGLLVAASERRPQVRFLAANAGESTATDRISDAAAIAGRLADGAGGRRPGTDSNQLSPRGGVSPPGSPRPQRVPLPSPDSPPIRPPSRSTPRPAQFTNRRGSLGSS